MSIPKGLCGSLLVLAITMAGAQSAQAEPLTPLTPAELQYLEQVRRVFSVSRDNAAFRSDAELLERGRRACQLRTIGLVGNEQTIITPAITQLAFIYLCPN